MKRLYYDFAMSVKEKICEEVNGRLIFEAYEDIDTVIFKMSFKDFNFSYAVNNVQDRIYSGTTGDVPDEFKKAYWTAIKRAFFKTENHKRRDEMSRLGVATV